MGLLPGERAAARPPVEKPSVAEMLCSIVLTEARKQGLPESFFTRVIWRESLFDPKAVSPKGAQGIAQFMPGTARDRGLADPFLAGQALAASAHLLSELRATFGNLGLAAAAYNAGADRVRNWLLGLAELPLETLDYVLFITGRPANDWMKAEASFAMPEIGKGEGFTKDCLALASRQRRPLTRAELETSGTPVASAPLTPWGAQLAGAPSRGAALAAYQRLKKLHGDVLAGVTPLIIRRRLPGLGRSSRVQVRIGVSTRAEAERFCGKLRAQGSPAS